MFLWTLTFDLSQARTVWEEKQSNMAENVSRLKEELLQAEHNKQLREQELRQVQQVSMKVNGGQGSSYGYMGQQNGGFPQAAM